MRRLHYHRVDVFTNRPFGGNPLAVFTNGRDLATETMQAIAREMNLSESARARIRCSAFAKITIQQRMLNATRTTSTNFTGSDA